MAALLAAVAGFVDAVGSTGSSACSRRTRANVAFLGMAIGGDGPAAGGDARLLSITGFAVGTAAGFMLGHRLGPRLLGPTLIVVELVLLVIVTMIAGKVDGRGRVRRVHRRRPRRARQLRVMGIQTEAIRPVAGVWTATTYQSGAVGADR